MKRILLLALLTNQTQAADLSKLGKDLGKVYQQTLEVEVQTSRQETLRKQISASLMEGVLKINFLPLNELKEQFLASPLEATLVLPTLQESLRLQKLYLQFDSELTEAEKRLMETFYSSSPYQSELAAYQDFKLSLEENFSPAMNLTEGYQAMESMLSQFSELGFRWERKLEKGSLEFIFDQSHFRKIHQVSAPEFLRDKPTVLKQLLQGPGRKLNYLKTAQSYLSQRFGVEHFEVVLKDLVGKLKL